MREILKVGRVSAVGCEELGRLGLVDTSVCCEICHSVGLHATGVSLLGPCRATLPGGGEAFVCCAGKRQLSGQANRSGTEKTQGGSQ
jgi:hypothetical protein